MPEISGVLSSLSSLTAGAYSANHVYTPTDASWASQELIANANSIAGEQGAAQAAYTDLQAHAAALQALRDHLATASSPKDVQDAQAQIELEQVWTTNEAAQLAAINAAYAAQRDAMVQRLLHRWDLLSEAGAGGFGTGLVGRSQPRGSRCSGHQSGRDVADEVSIWASSSEG